MTDIAALAKRLRHPSGDIFPMCRQAADSLEALQTERNGWHEAWHKEEQANRIAFAGGYVAALEKAAKVAEDEEQFVVATLIRALKHD